eukprot:2625898-Amphidinium_carterae.1
MARMARSRKERMEKEKGNSTLTTARDRLHSIPHPRLQRPLGSNLRSDQPLYTPQLGSSQWRTTLPMLPTPGGKSPKRQNHSTKLG